MVPDVITYSELISACDKGKESEQAMGIFAEMRRQGVVLNAISYNAANLACAVRAFGLMRSASMRQFQDARRVGSGSRRWPCLGDAGGKRDMTRYQRQCGHLCV